MSSVLLSIAVVAVFIAVGGVFAAAEIALISLRESQVRALSARSRRGRRLASLAANPNRFLASVQLGVTLSGFLSAAFGEQTLAGKLRPMFQRSGISTGVADVLATLVITLVISYFALVFGELVPKRLGLQRAEGIALVMAPFLDRVARVSRPVIWLLSRSVDLVVRLFGGDPKAARTQITEEELRGLVATHESLTGDERRMIDEVFAAGDKQLREVMVPRTEVHFLDAALSLPKAFEQAQKLPHSRYPVVRSSPDEVIGFVHVRDLVAAIGGRRPGLRRVGDITRPVKLVPASKPLLPAMSEMRRESSHLAVVVDEYGGTAGIVTLEDLLEEVVGDIRDEYDSPNDNPDSATEDGGRAAAARRQGPIDVDGLLSLDDFTDRTGITLAEGPYETVAGFLVNSLGRLPRAGDAVEVPAGPPAEKGSDGAGTHAPRRATLTVRRVEHRRIARLRVTWLDDEAAAGGDARPGADVAVPGGEATAAGADRVSDRERPSVDRDREPARSAAPGVAAPALPDGSRAGRRPAPGPRVRGAVPAAERRAAPPPVVRRPRPAPRPRPGTAPSDATG